ncbi:hypothetical protein CDG81_19560 [Actinopolyspora erythraea]|uniref:Uncharacterized protein n=1 Tax=Actinopolyspora erythraea TaxID=414996 RepID=A0A223RW60_9ACTN|nr:hypothetical protein CDG81_19560 [Actinopolyspora erythraea]
MAAQFDRAAPRVSWFPGEPRPAPAVTGTGAPHDAPERAPSVSRQIVGRGTAQGRTPTTHGTGTGTAAGSPVRFSRGRPDVA